MQQIRSLVFPATYRDSVFLMQLSSLARKKSGARQVSAIMASARNKELLARSDLLTPELEEAGPDDLAVAIEAPEEMLDATESLIRAMLAEPAPRPEGLPEAAPLPLTLAAAMEQKPESKLAIISVAGDYARYEAAQALSLGLDVLLYSDNINATDERALKDLARRKGCLLMGPDCGTAIVRGVPLGFANQVRRGLIGLIGSSGTGLQEVSCLLDRCGLGISHAYGTGGRDLKDKIGGITTLAALKRLEDDPGTEVIALIAKRPGPETRKRLAEAYTRIGKPVILRYLGVTEYGLELEAGARVAMDITELSRLAAQQLAPMLDLSAIDEDTPSFQAPVYTQNGCIRGVFSGGTLCFEAMEIIERELGCTVKSNIERMSGPSGIGPAPESGEDSSPRPHTHSSDAPSLPGAAGALPEDFFSGGHIFMDMGAPAFTIGRPHPLISPEPKMERLYAELMDPDVAVVLTDIVLGYGVFTTQASYLVQTMDRAAAASRGESRKKTVLVSVCGTEGDSPSRSSQATLLQQAGVLVAGNNAQAARWAARIIGGKPRPERSKKRG